MKLVYPSHACLLSPKDATLAEVNMQRKLVSAFEELAKSGSKAQLVGSVDMFLAIELIHGAVECSVTSFGDTIYACLNDALDSSGPDPAVQVFTIYEVFDRDATAGGDPYTGTVLTVCREPAIMPYEVSPLSIFRSWDRCRTFLAIVDGSVVTEAFSV